MKKSILIVMFLMVIGFTYAQESKEVSISETERIIDKYLDKTSDALESLATVLKIPTDHVYKILVRQQVIKSISILVSLILGLSISLLSIKFAYVDYNRKNMMHNKKYDNEDDYKYYDLDDSWWILVIISGGIIAVGCILGLIGASHTIISGIINPEYGAMQEIMKVF